MLYLLPYPVDLGGVAAVVFEGLLGDYPAPVEFGIHIMHGDSVDFHPVLHGLLDRVGPRKAGSREGWMLIMRPS